ncbi:hypothetical protein FQN52_005185 [Onygenales sp. PD_12]|nr:hypothetical protein FQN51_001184 [Onygenales sp. PD_10]KAK2795419.1 hypothetical protein FQN52_005185 [Onygenales sp. PD_12]
MVLNLQARREHKLRCLFSIIRNSNQAVKLMAGTLATYRRRRVAPEIAVGETRLDLRLLGRTTAPNRNSNTPTTPYHTPLPFDAGAFLPPPPRAIMLEHSGSNSPNTV